VAQTLATGFGQAWVGGANVQRQARLNTPIAGAGAERVAGEAEALLATRMVAAQQGDAAAYQALLRDCVPVIARVVRAVGVTPDRVDDAVQETLLTVHRARHTYDPARPFLPWLRAIARRRAIDAMRRYGRQSVREVHDDLAYEQHASPESQAEQALDQTGRVRALGEAVAMLPPRQREALEHLGLAERTLEEAAALTGRTKGALKVNLHRALKTLRALMGGPAGHD
jgi:RNA polymerase sigma-70 factor (ECF subfamily)